MPGLKTVSTLGKEKGPTKLYGTYLALAVVWGLLLFMCLVGADVLPSLLRMLKCIFNSHYIGFSVLVRL